MLTEEEFSLLSAKDKRDYLKRLRGSRGRDDLLYLVREILGYRDVDDVVHGGIIKFLDRSGKKKLVLMPRGSFKTTVVTIGRTIQKILQNGDVRVLLDSEVLGYSEKLLAQIKRDMSKPEFVGIYGKLVSSDHRETSREFTVKTRKNLGLKEPTVSAAGIGTVQVGPHYDVIVADDLHSENNITTKEQIEKVIAHYRLLLSLLEPDGELVIVGTRWHFKDLYSHIIEDESKRPGSNWDILIEKAIRDDGSLFFPKRLTRDFLEEQKRSQGAAYFSVLYQNDPVSNEDAVFKKEDFRYWEGETYPCIDGKRVFLNVYILIDRAFSSKESADYTGCLCVGVSTTGNIYVLEAERHKFGLQELFDLIVKWINRYGSDRIRKVGIETINYEELDVFFTEQMRKKNKFFIKERLMPDRGKSKNLRIQTAMEARYKNHAVFHKKGMWDLEDELIRFPVGRHDDLIDALAYVVPFMTIPGNPGNERDDIDYEPSGLFGRTGY